MALTLCCLSVTAFAMLPFGLVAYEFQHSTFNATEEITH